MSHLCRLHSNMQQARLVAMTHMHGLERGCQGLKIFGAGGDIGTHYAANFAKHDIIIIQVASAIHSCPCCGTCPAV